MVAVRAEPVASWHGPQPGRKAEGVVRAVARVAQQQQHILLARAAHGAVVLGLRISEGAMHCPGMHCPGMHGKLAAERVK